MASATTTGNWCDLPSDILGIICSKLVVIKDFVAMDAVCSHWQSVRFHFDRLIPPQVPLLMSGREHAFFSTQDDLRHKHAMPWPETFCRCYGSSHGWLITGDFYGDLSILNPFIPSSLVLLPLLDKGFDICKAVLSDNPSRASNYLVVVMSTITCKLAFLRIRSGETESWVELENVSGPIRFKDIAYFKEELYVVGSGGELLSCNMKITLPKLRLVISPLDFSTQIWSWSMHLVESSGDLLCIAETIHTFGFRVFKMIKCEWIQVENLGGHAVFMDDYSTVSLLASDFPQYCKPDCIYFAIETIRRGQKIGVLNLEDGKIQCLQPKEIGFEPVWVQPSLNATAPVVQVPPSRMKKTISWLGSLITSPSWNILFPSSLFLMSYLCTMFSKSS